MKNAFQYKLIAAAISSLLLAGCGDAETTIVEKPPIAQPDDSHGDDNHDHGNDITIESLGRLAVLSAESNEAAIIDLDDKSLLDTFSLVHESNSLKTSAGFRYAVIGNRSNDYVGFIDGGLWRENHDDHLHDYKQGPALSDMELSGSRPTHIVNHDGQMAVFYDSDSESSTPASVQVVRDDDITNESSDLATLSYDTNMHGVAEPRGEYLISTVRRDDAESTSGAKILPDQVGVYHLHGNEYEQEQLFEVTCPDLHGAAQNEHYVAFGCGDSVMLVHQHDNSYEASKIANIDAMEGLRIGNLYGHEKSESFIGIASQRGNDLRLLVNVAAEAGELELLEWQPATDAAPVSYGFSYMGDHFLVLDSQGMLNILAAHQHDGETHWELEAQVDISEQDIADMPEGLSFTMAIAQNANQVYISDPIAKHVVQVDLEAQAITADIELDYAASHVSWLGIAEAEEHDH